MPAPSVQLEADLAARLTDGMVCNESYRSGVPPLAGAVLHSEDRTVRLQVSDGRADVFMGEMLDWITYVDDNGCDDHAHIAGGYMQVLTMSYTQVAGTASVVVDGEDARVELVGVVMEPRPGRADVPVEEEVVSVQLVDMAFDVPVVGAPVPVTRVVGP